MLVTSKAYARTGTLGRGEVSLRLRTHRRTKGVEAGVVVSMVNALLETKAKMEGA